MSDENEGGRNCRGIYRRKSRVQWQTLYSRKKLLSKSATTSDLLSTEAVQAESELSRSNSCATSTASHNNDSYGETVETETTVINADCLPKCNDSQSSDQLMVAANQPRLYEGLSLSINTSTLMLKSYMCRHHLTGLAKEDLLQLLKLHLPKENKLPSSMHLFQNQVIPQIDQSEVQAEVTSTHHHYCPKCLTALTDSDATNCPNSLCDVEITFESSPYFLTVSIADQLKTFFSSKTMQLHTYINIIQVDTRMYTKIF